jgi:tetratricopeptide (TPR) repeat protein
MAQYNRPPKQKPPKADEFISFFDRLILYCKFHQDKFFIVLGAAVLALIGYGIYNFQISRKIDKVATDYFQAEKAPQDQALTVWEKVESMKPPAQLPELIALQIGGIYSKDNQWAKAAEAFQKSSQSSSSLIQSVGSLAHATALENDQKYQDALAIYQKISFEKNNPFKEEGQLGAARCLVGMGKANDAETILYQILAKGSDAAPAIKSAALNKLLVLKLKGEKGAPAAVGSKAESAVTPN